MRKPLLHTKVTVKLRKSEYREEWYLYTESYPVRNPGSTKPKRVVEAVNRIITTPVWDTTAITGIDEDGNYKYTRQARLKNLKPWEEVVSNGDKFFPDPNKKKEDSLPDSTEEAKE